MAKTHLKQVDNGTPTRPPERVVLAAAIENHNALKTALDENLISQKRAEAARWEAHRKVDVATKDVEVAKITDAEAIGQGGKAGATKAARTALQDAEDELEAAKSARTLLEQQLTATDGVQNRFATADLRLKAAIADVIRAAPEVARLLERYEAARHAFHNLHGMLFPLFGANVLPREYEPTINNIDIREVVHKHLAPSPIAANVQAWIEQLRTNADAELAE